MHLNLWRSKRRILVGAFIALIAVAGIAAFKSSVKKQTGASPTGPAIASPAAQADASASLTYTHPDPALSFEYPQSFTVTALPPDDSGQTILVRNPNGQRQEFQIRISEFDEPGPITQERILKDIPDMVIDSPQTVSVGGASALTFLSQDVSLGKTREVWFVSGGFLYQITAYAEMDEVLGKILQTWKFQ